MKWLQLPTLWFGKSACSPNRLAYGSPRCYNRRGIVDHPRSMFWRYSNACWVIGPRTWGSA
eukprot:1192120-Alexandrium_andersonii.AAC.1